MQTVPIYDVLLEYRAELHAGDPNSVLIILGGI